MLTCLNHPFAVLKFLEYLQRQLLILIFFNTCMCLWCPCAFSLVCVFMGLLVPTYKCASGLGSLKLTSGVFFGHSSLGLKLANSH